MDSALFWLFAASLSLISFIILFVALRSGRTLAAPSGAPVRAHHARLLQELERDHALQRLSAAELEAAKAELAREVLRAEQDDRAVPETPGLQLGAMAVGLLVVPVAALALYFWLGRPDMPSLPLQDRPEVAEMQQVRDALDGVEQMLRDNPDNAELWAAIGPVYLQLGRFDDAVEAYTRVNALRDVSANSLTNEAEARLFANQGRSTPTIDALLNRAMDLDPNHVRSRFHYASLLTQVGNWTVAEAAWLELLALAQGNEPWLQIAQQGLSVARARGGQPEPLGGLSDDERDQVNAMVSGLEARLMENGGSIEEWTRLVRSLLVLGQNDAATDAYNRAVAAYPDAGERAALDELAASAGIDQDAVPPQSQQAGEAQ